MNVGKGERESGGVNHLILLFRRFTDSPIRPFTNNKGMALLMTILVVALLSMLILDIHSRSYMAITRAKNSVNGLKAYYIMRSGISAAQGFLEIDAKATNVDTLTEDWAQGVKGFPVGDGVVSIDIVDEASKFNITTLVNDNGTINQKQVERFARLLYVIGVDENLASRTVTWLKDNRKDFSYAFRDISELRLVEGVTTELYNKLKNFITIYTSRTGTNINPNTVSREVLASLSPLLTEALIVAIMDYRKEHSFINTGDLIKVQGIDDSILSSFSGILISYGQSSNNQSSQVATVFTVSAEAKVSDTVRRGTAVLTRTGTGTTIKVVAWKEE